VQGWATALLAVDPVGDRWLAVDASDNTSRQLRLGDEDPSGGGTEDAETTPAVRRSGGDPAGP
jgi:hypothetical protein